MLAQSWSFPRSARLLSGADYQRVFKRARKASDVYFTVLARPNHGCTARLGLAVAKKQAKRAVDRNRLKRLIRESFRHHQKQLAGLDLVVMVRAASVACDNAVLMRALEALWQQHAERPDSNPRCE